jgi:CRP-like cAMP-binding protein
MYILRSGRVRVSITKDERTVPITELGEGSTVGELSFISAIPRTATVTALEPVIANRISPDVLSGDAHSIDGWAISIARVLVDRIRRTTDLLGDYVAGTHQDPAESAGAPFGLKAAFAVEANSASGIIRLKGVFDRARLNSVKSAIRKTLLARPEGITLDFSAIMDIDMDALSFLSHLAQSSKAKTGNIQLRNMQLIRNKIAGIKEINSLIFAAHLPVRRVEPLTYLIRQGERERSMFVVSAGEFDILEEQEGAEPLLLGKAQVGDVVGEMSLLREGWRSASVRAAKTSSVIEIAPKDFYANLYAVPDWFMRLLDGLVDRLRDTNEMLFQASSGAEDRGDGEAQDTPMRIELDGRRPGTLSLSGTLNQVNMEQLSPMIKHAIYSGHKEITLKMYDVEKIDKEGIRYILNLHKGLKESGGRLILQGSHRHLLWLADLGAEEKLAGLQDQAV